MLTTSKKEWTAVLVTTALLMAVFAFTDLSITLKVFNPESFFGQFFQVVGEMPNHLMAVLSGAALILYKGSASGIKRCLQILWGAFILFVGGSMGSAMPLKYAQIDNSAAAGVLMIAIIVLALITASRLSVGSRAKAKTLAMFGSVYFFTMLVVLNLLKLVWGRMRFQFMTDPASEFTPWYVLNSFAKGNAYMSFPSGHTAQATAMLFIVLALICLFPRLQGKLTLLKGCAYGWVVLVAVSRVIMGAHFASDVTFGFFFSWLLFLLWKKVFMKEEILHEQRI